VHASDLMASLSALIAQHGYWVVAAVVGLESMGIPLPGETMLVSAAVYAGATHQLNILMVIAWATIGAILGDNAGYLIGKRFGYPLLLRHGSLLGITTSRIKLGQYLFLRHGGKVVFFGRFIAVLRVLAASLAGVNCMPWPRFLVCNAAGAVVWAGSYGTLAYLLGDRVQRFTKPVGITIIVAAIAGAVLLIKFVRGHENALEAEAERLLPGPLEPRRMPHGH
jgi:membrane protein DedA with SNARE-associated domain